MLNQPRITSGIDPNDDNPLINPYSCEFIEDGIDNNLNGYIDELILKINGETIALDDDNIAYDEDRGTRRKIFFRTGETINIFRFFTRETSNNWDL